MELYYIPVSTIFFSSNLVLWLNKVTFCTVDYVKHKIIKIITFSEFLIYIEFF